jgi:hypothetical protein
VIDHCPARIEPWPADVPILRQIRVTDAGGRLVAMWLDGLMVRSVELPAGVRVRQAGCRCTANPRLVTADPNYGSTNSQSGQPTATRVSPASYSDQAV